MAIIHTSSSQVLLLRHSISDLYENEGDWSRAAEMLIGINFDSRIPGNSTKFDKYVHISHLCLMDKDVLQAEHYIEKASTFLQQIREPDAIMKYKECNAECLSMKLKLLEAAEQYYDISKTTQSEIGTIQIRDEDMQDFLNSAVMCALLCGASPDSRILTMLAQDKRCPKLKICTVLQKVITGEILNKHDLAALEEELMPYHKTPLPDNSTLLDQMMTEHNLLCTNIDNNPSFDLFNSMLGMDPQKVIKSAAVMSASQARSVLGTVKDEITKAHDTLNLERDDYDAFVMAQPERRLHLGIAQAHERAERGYLQMTKTVENILVGIDSELGFAIDSLGSELASIDLTLAEP